MDSIKLSKSEYLRIFLLFCIFILFFLRFKNTVVTVMFILLDILLMILSSQYGLKNPLKIVDFAVFATSFAFSPINGVFIASAHILMLPFSGKLGPQRIISNLALIPIAFLASLLRPFGFAAAGITVTAAKMVFDYVANFMMFHDVGSMKKNIRRIIDLGFWLLFYLAFGNFFYSLLK